MSNIDLDSNDPNFEKICGEIRGDLELRLVDSMDFVNVSSIVSPLQTEAIRKLLDDSSTWYETEQLSQKALMAFERLIDFA